MSRRLMLYGTAFTSSMTLVASVIKLLSSVFEMKGKVREARRLHSITFRDKRPPAPPPIKKTQKTPEHGELETGYKNTKRTSFFISNPFLHRNKRFTKIETNPRNNLRRAKKIGVLLLLLLLSSWWCYFFSLLGNHIKLFLSLDRR